MGGKLRLRLDVYKRQRLNCEDAKWIYDNCQLGTQVNISSTLTSGPLAKPAGLQIPSWHTWDPTDPTAYVYCCLLYTSQLLKNLQALLLGEVQGDGGNGLVGMLVGNLF